MKFRLNSPKFLTFLCYINLRLGKVCLHYKYDKKTINDWLKEYKSTFTRFVSNVTFNEKQQTNKFCYRLYKPKFSNNLGILQFLHHK